MTFVFYYLCSVDQHPFPIVTLLVELEVGVRLAKKVLKFTQTDPQYLAAEVTHLAT